MELLAQSTSNYPYIEISIEIDNFKRNGEALADTGFDLGIKITKNKFDENKIKQKYFTCPIETGDGKVRYWKAYAAKISLGKKDFDSTLIVGEEGEELILGMEILNQLYSIFDGPSSKLKIYKK